MDIDAQRLLFAAHQTSGDPGVVPADHVARQAMASRIATMARNDTDYWIDLARYDIRAAKAMLKAKQRLYVGFLCHLVIEKTLKAYWADVKKSAAPFTHDLSLLADKTGILSEMDERALTVLDFLEPLHIEGRYPTEKSRLLRMLTPSKCAWLMKETERLHKWIKSRLSKK